MRKTAVRNVLLLGLALAVLAGCQVHEPPTTGQLPGPDVAALDASADRIPGQYIVVFKRGVRDVPGLARALVQAHGGTRLYTYQNALEGFAARLPPQAVEALRRNPNVASIVQDGVVSASTSVQAGATWGLDRVDQRDLPLDESYTYSADGSGVTVYVFDTGIRYDHEDFGDRASFGFDAFGGDGNDCEGHGTHVAGTVGGTTYGVAKEVSLVSVRVLDCDGYGPWSGVIAGIDWVTANAAKPAVANMSLGGGAYSLVDMAVQNSTAAGITYVVAAGNDNADACGTSPARAPEALTVAASSNTDARAAFSNWGSCVDLFAPGVDITSALHTSDTATGNKGGTSMASPHVAGVAALYLQLNPNAGPTQVKEAVLATSTPGRVTNTNGSPNRLLFSGLTEPPATPVLELSTGSLGFTFYRESASLIFPTTATSSIQVRNTGTAAMDWAVSANPTWVSAGPANGTLAAGTSTEITAAIDPAALGVGSHAGTIMLTAPDAPNSPATAAVNVNVVPVTRMQVNTPITVSAPWNASLYFRLELEEGDVGDLLIRTHGGTGHIGLYVSHEAIPRTFAAADCYQGPPGTAKTCGFPAAKPGSYWVLIHTAGTAGNNGIILEAVSLTSTQTALSLAPAQQQYSDAVRLDAAVTPSTATGAVLFQRSVNGSAYSNVGGPVPVINGAASLPYHVTQAAGADLRFRAVFAATGDYGGSTSDVQVLSVVPEDATVRASSGNPAALRVSSAGGSLAAGALTLAFEVQETSPDVAIATAAPGDIGNANLAVSLVPVSGGSSHVLSCTAASVVGVGYDAVRPFTCTNAGAVPVDAFEVVASVTGGYYGGGLTDAFTVYDPSLGFATGGGTFVLDGDRVNFGFATRYNPRGNNVRGSFVAVRHHSDGTTSRVKSNALGSLALGDDPSGAFGWASFDGRATYTVWDVGAQADVTIGNQRFEVYVEDRDGTGGSVDRMWLGGPGALAMPGSRSTARNNTVALEGGNISIPRGGRRN